MSIKITIPNSSSDVLTFGSGNTPTAAQIAGIDSGSSNGQLALYTTASGTSTERVRVDSSGNVGIGTSSPGERLRVQNTTGVNTTFTNSVDADVKINLTSGVALISPSTGVLALGTSSTERMRIDTSGNLLVGTTSVFGAGGISIQPSAAAPTVDVKGSATTNGSSVFNVYSTGASAYRFYVGMGGTISATSTTISSLSDSRLKENVRDLDVGLDAIMALKPRLYDWKEGKGADIKNARGFIAQEFETVFPDLIDEWRDPAPEGEDPYKSVRQDLIPTLVKAIQEQQAIITSLTDRITALEGATS